jgi:hypothetical protein
MPWSGQEQQNGPHDRDPEGQVMPMAHHEVPVKVTAWVDEDVADLVLALNAMPGVLTLDSCQEDPDGLARVTFCTHENTALRKTVDHLAGVIGGQAWDRQVNLSLWAGCDGETLVADLLCPPSLVPALAGQVRSSAARMSRFSHDTARTKPGSWTVRHCHPLPLPSGDGTQPRTRNGKRG